MRLTPTLAALAGLTLAASGSDLKLDGSSSLTKPLGTSLHVEVTGNKNLPVLLAYDVSPGPVMIFGENVPLGFTPSLSLFPIGMTTGMGILGVDLPVPNLPGLVGLTLYLDAALIDPVDPNGFDFTPGADLTFGPSVDKVSTELACNSIATRPFVEYVRAWNLGSPVQLAVDPLAHPSVAGLKADLYVVDSRTTAEWDQNTTLVDVSSGGAETVTFSASGIAANTFTVDTGTLAAGFGTDIGRGYDLIVDLDQDGQLSSGDLIDGYGEASGMYVVRDLTQPGPYAVTEFLHSGGSWLGQDIYHPTNIASLGKLPLVVISHGNGHNYQWYDHLGEHLASWGFVVMSHQNNTGPGIETASTTTLTNTDHVIRYQNTIGGGVLLGHIDKKQITWLGHSRGGEGVARAYDRIFDGTYSPIAYKLSDIKLISSIAPTDFLGSSSATPHDANYHLWVGASDADVTGCASNNIAQSFHLHDRAENQRQSISLHGVGHGDFHDGGGSSVATGPCKVGRPQTHLIMKGYALPLIQYHILGNVPSKDYLTRQYESFHAIGAPVSDPCVVADLMFRESTESGKYVIDDFQTNTSPSLASSGAAVSFSVASLSEGRLDDGNTNFTNNLGDAFNGFTHGNSSDTTRGIVFSAEGVVDHHLTFDVLAADADWTDFRDLSFRACQATRHPLTTAALGDSVFEVELIDGSGNASVIRIDAFGGGVEEPYQRTSCGTGAGWGNEFETIRLPLTGFTVDDAAFNLADVDKLVFRFGPSHGSPGGRYGLDDIELTKE